MTNFSIYSLETAPPRAEQTAQNVAKKYGSIPNLVGALLEAPEVAQAYVDLGDALKNSAFSAKERHVVWFTINRLHDCRYCMAAHTTMAKGEKIDAAVIEAARGDEDYPNERLNLLKEFTTKMVMNRGWVEPIEVQEFVEAGFSNRHVLDIVLAISHKVISNYTNHLVETPLDDRFSANRWSPPE